MVVVLVVAGAALPAYPAWITGLFAWSACVLLPALPRRQLVMVLLLVVLGALGIVWGMASGKGGLLEIALTQNIPLTGMLIAVSFAEIASRYDEGAPLAAHSIAC